MRPYRASICVLRSVPVLLLCLLVVTAAIGVRGNAADKPAAIPSPFPPSRIALDNDPVTRSGFEHYYSLEYERAIADFEKVRQAHPEDPVAINHLLNALLFRELYRAGALETAQYAGNSFVTKKQVKVAPEVEKQIRELMEAALRSSQRRLDTNSNDIEALYARGVTLGLRATYTALVDKAWFSALRSAIAARHDHERVLELDPTFADAKTSVGVQNYIAGSLPFAVKVGVSLVGLSGSKSKGIQYLYDAAAAKGETSADARVALCLFLRREQRFEEALKVARSLIADHPRNFLFAVEEGNVLNAGGHGPEAIASLRQIIEAGKKGKYPDPHLEVPLFSLGEALKGQRQFADAADAYEQVPGYPRADTDLRQRAHLYAGQMADAANHRDRAIRNYNAALADDPQSEHAQLARKYLKSPYHL
jgi:tetratricopeptide (TPR) repeat protein